MHATRKILVPKLQAKSVVGLNQYLNWLFVGVFFLNHCFKLKSACRKSLVTVCHYFSCLLGCIQLEKSFGGKDPLFLYYAFMYDSEIGTREVIWQTVATKLVPLFCLHGNSGRGERGNTALSLNAETACWLLRYLCNRCKVVPCNRMNMEVTEES